MIRVNRFKCAYCGACIGVCRFDANELVETWVEINDNCTECMACVKICPLGALEVENEN